MPSRRYPRRGERIAPESLREILDVPVPQQYPTQISKLADLDESVWSELSDEQCRELGRYLVDFIRGMGHILPERISSQPLPTLPNGFALESLDLDVRTFNALLRSGWRKNGYKWRKESFQGLEGLTIGEIWLTRNFGPHSLVDLLTALEAAHKLSGVQSDLESYLLQKTEPNSSYQQAQVAATRLCSSHPAFLGEVRRLSIIREADEIYDDDPRLGLAIRALQETAKPTGASLLMVTEKIAKRRIDDSNVELMLQQVRQLHDRIRDLKTYSLEDELAGLVTSVSGRGRIQQTDTSHSSATTSQVAIPIQRLGWDGQGGDTLQNVGVAYGITRERVRQIGQRATKQLIASRYPFAPRLDQALDLVHGHAPAPAQAIEELLHTSKIAKTSFRLEGLLTASKVLGRRAQFQLSDVGRFVFRTGANEGIEETKLAKLIHQAARKSVQHWGATTIADLTARLLEETVTAPVTAELVTAILEHQKGFQWLDETSGWFWLTSVPERRNRLLNYIKKMLSVVERIDISDLRAGVSRNYRMAGVSPPKRVLLELCRQVEGYRVEGTTVIADSPLDWGRVLAETEATMALVLIEHGPIMQRAQFEEICLSLGINRTTFYIYLDNSPIIARYARGVYGLPGAAASPDLIESLIPDQSRGKRLVDYGWTNDGQIWVAYKLSAGTITSGVVTVPGSMKHFIMGSFDLLTTDNSPVGRLVAKDSSAWGLGPYFRRRGGEPNDYLLLTFDLSRREARIAVGDEDVLRDYVDS